MSWDERLFGRLFARLRRRREHVADARGVAVAPERRRLALVASALAGRRMTITIATGDGGVRGAHLVLPARLDALATPDANAALLLARVAVGAIMARAPTPPLGDDATGAEEPRALDGELPHWAAAPYRHRVAGLDLGVLRGHVPGGQDVGEEDHPLVR